MNQSPPFKGLYVEIPIIIPIKGKGFIIHGSASGNEGIYHMELCSRRLEKTAWKGRLRDMGMIEKDEHRFDMACP